MALDTLVSLGYTWVNPELLGGPEVGCCPGNSRHSIIL